MATAEALAEFTADLGILVESGFVAIKQGDEESAKKLFNAVDIVDKEGLQKRFGYGLIALHKMEIESAVTQFEEILQKDKQNWRAQSFLAFAYMLSMFGKESDVTKIQNLKKATELSQEIIEKCDEESTLKVAQSILDWEQEVQDQTEKKKGPLG